MPAPPVSVLMTTYNREAYVGMAIESVLASTFTDFELIISDDRSTDGTVPIIQTFTRRDRRVRLHINERTLGDYPNRNRAASLATGDYLKYVDADDYLYPQGLETLTAMMAKFPDAGYGLCSLEQDRERPFPFALSPGEAYRRHYFHAPVFHKAPLSSIIRRSAWRRVGGFPEQRMVGDFAMWHRLSTEFDVVLMPYGPVWYREHDGQEMADVARDPLHYRLAYERVVQAALAAPECPLNAGERRDVRRRYARAGRRATLKALLQLRLGAAWRLTRHTREFGRA